MSGMGQLNIKGTASLLVLERYTIVITVTVKNLAARPIRELINLIGANMYR